jgi:hypothetical protein
MKVKGMCIERRPKQAVPDALHSARSSVVFGVFQRSWIPLILDG